MLRKLRFYDLIQLPSGKHIPVLPAIEMIGLDRILKIPISYQKRDGAFLLLFSLCSPAIHRVTGILLLPSINIGILCVRFLQIGQGKRLNCVRVMHPRTGEVLRAIPADMKIAEEIIESIKAARVKGQKV
jgi:hypothetical protein